MNAPQVRLNVIHAFICDEIRVREREGSRVDFIGVRDWAEMPASGVLDLRGLLAIKIVRGPVILATGLAMPTDSVTCEMAVQLIGPKGTVPPLRRELRFDANTAIARESIDLRPLATDTVGMHAFNIGVDGLLLTSVPLLVVPHGAAQEMTRALRDARRPVKGKGN